MASVQSRRFLRKLLALLREGSETLALDPVEPGGPRVETCACRVGRVARGEPLVQRRLHITKALGQRNLARAHVIAAAAFDAIEQSVRFERIEIAAPTAPV